MGGGGGLLSRGVMYPVIIVSEYYIIYRVAIPVTFDAVEFAKRGRGFTYTMTRMAELLSLILYNGKQILKLR